MINLNFNILVGIHQDLTLKRAWLQLYYPRRGWSVSSQDKKYAPVVPQIQFWQDNNNNNNNNDDDDDDDDENDNEGVII